jgi:hypothetical protein
MVRDSTDILSQSAERSTDKDTFGLAVRNNDPLTI